MTKQLSRRTVIRGMGAALSLPLLEAMAPARAAHAAAKTAPRRMAFLFVPNGVHMPDWTPEQAGYVYDLPYILKPLESVRNDFSILTGLTHDKGRANGDGPGDHARSASVFLTGAQPRKTSSANIRSGVSVDQAAAQEVGKLTRFPSLELGTEAGRGAGNCDSGYSCAYSSNIAWSSPSTPVGKEVNPRLVFERLFAGGTPKEQENNREERTALKKSLLDFLKEDSRRLRAKLGQTDQRKLDQYLDGIRSIEQRIERTENEGPLVQEGDFQVPAGIPDSYAEHIRLMCDMMVLAFKADLTRISTFMLANAGSNRSYRMIDIADGHHSLSHHGGDPKKHAKIRQINRFHIDQFAYLLRELRAVREGEGTLLDNCMIIYGSGLSDGNRHNNENLPIILAGGGGGSLTPGRHVVYQEETPMNNLFLSMLDRVGAPIDFLGDSTGRLSNL